MYIYICIYIYIGCILPELLFFSPVFMLLLFWLPKPAFSICSSVVNFYSISISLK